MNGSDDEIDRLGRLRFLLYEPASARIWSALVRLFDDWPAAEGLDVAVAYAAERLDARWPPLLRCIANPYMAPHHPIWSLARHLKIHGNDAPRLLPLASEPGFVCHPRMGPMTHLTLRDHQLCDDDDVEALIGSALVRGLVHLDLGDNALAGHQLHRLVCAVGGLRSLNVSSNDLSGGDVGAMFEAPQSAALESLDLSFNNLQEQGGQALAQAEHLTNLRSLNLGFSRLGVEGVEALIGAAHLEGLKTLNIAGNGIGGALWETLSKAPWMKGVTSLWLGPNPLAPLVRSLEVLARGDWRLERLGLESVRIGSQAGAVLASAPSLSAVRTLNLDGCNLADEGLRALAEAPFIGGLERLNVSDNHMTPGGLEVLLKALGGGELAWLGLRRNPLGDKGAAVLGRAGLTRRLRALELSRCGLSTAGVRELVGALAQVSVETLDLSYNRLDADAAAVLGSHLERVRCLSLRHNPLGSGAVRHLIRARFAPSLEVLELGATGMNDDDAEALAAASHMGAIRSLDVSLNPSLGDRGLRALLEAKHLPGEVRARLVLSVSNALLDTLIADWGPGLGGGAVTRFEKLAAAASFLLSQGPAPAGE